MGRISYTAVNGVKDYFVWVIIHYKKHRRVFEGYFCVCFGGFCFVLLHEILKNRLIGVSVVCNVGDSLYAETS